MHVRHHSCGQEGRAHSRGLHNGARPTGKTEQVRLRARGAAPRLGGGAERGCGKEVQRWSLAILESSTRFGWSCGVGHVDHVGFESICSETRVERPKVRS